MTSVPREKRNDDEDGVEVFYNFSVAPWWTVGADLQIIDPGLQKNDTAIFAGLRTREQALIVADAASVGVALCLGL